MTVAYSLWQILFRNIFWNVDFPTTLLCQDRLAQSVEDNVLNPKVEGSTPPRVQPRLGQELLFPAGFARREKSVLVLSLSLSVYPLK